MTRSAAESQAMQRLTPPIACLFDTVELKPLIEKRTPEFRDFSYRTYMCVPRYAIVRSYKAGASVLEAD